MPELSNEALRARTHARYDFHTHAIIYGFAIYLLALVDAFTEGGPWFVWPMLGWGIALGVHAFRVFVRHQLPVDARERRALAREVGTADGVREQPHVSG